MPFGQTLQRWAGSLKAGIDAAAARVNPDFPVEIHTDSFSEGKKVVSAYARRNTDGSFNAYRWSGSRFRLKNDGPLVGVDGIVVKGEGRSLSLAAAVQLLDAWNKAQESNPALTKDPEITLGFGAYYKNVARLRNISLS